MILRNCNLGDIMYVACQLPADEWEQIEKFGVGRDLDSLVTRTMLIGGPRWAYVDDERDADKALVVGGFIPQRKGVYQSWFLASKQAWALYGRQVTALAKERLSWMMTEGGAHRVETVCLASRKLAQRWYKSTGLRFESTLTGYCIDGSDAVMFVATKGAPCA